MPRVLGVIRLDTPVEDQMLAQKLLLEHEPDKFFKNANVSPTALTPGSIQWIDDRTLINPMLLGTISV